MRFSARGDPTRYDSTIGEVIRASPDVVVTANNPLVLRFKALMKSTPIVALMGDPVAWGIVQSFAHPGGNITGIGADAGEEIWGKRRCPLIEIDRKWLAEGQNDAFDPERTSASISYCSGKIGFSPYQSLRLSR